MKFELNRDQAATLIVDMQRLFTEPASPFQNDAGELVEPINRLTSHSRQHGIPVIHSSYLFNDDGSDAGLISNWPQVQDGYFATGSPWTDWDPRFVVEDTDHLISRHRPGAFFGGVLDELLSRLGKTQLLLAGLSLNNALSFTAHEAFSRDIPVFLVKDTTGLAPFENAAHLDIHLQAIGTWAAEVVTLDGILKETGS